MIVDIQLQACVFDIVLPPYPQPHEKMCKDDEEYFW